MNFSMDMWRDRSWRCSMVDTKPKPTGQKMIRLLLLGPRANQSRARRLEVCAGKWFKPRMCVLSVKKSCWNSLCSTAGVWAAVFRLGSGFHAVVVSVQSCFRMVYVLVNFCSTTDQIMTPYCIMGPNAAHPVVDVQHVSRKPPAQICGCYKIRFKSPGIHRRGHFIQTQINYVENLYLQYCADRFLCALMCCPCLSQVHLWQ